jgi:hypothetical protein
MFRTVQRFRGADAGGRHPLAGKCSTSLMGFNSLLDDAERSGAPFVFVHAAASAAPSSFHECLYFIGSVPLVRRRDSRYASTRTGSGSGSRVGDRRPTQGWRDKRYAERESRSNG